MADRVADAFDGSVPAPAIDDVHQREHSDAEGEERSSDPCRRRIRDEDEDSDDNGDGRDHRSGSDEEGPPGVSTLRHSLDVTRVGCIDVLIHTAQARQGRPSQYPIVLGITLSDSVC